MKSTILRNAAMVFLWAFSSVSGAGSADPSDAVPIWRYTVKPGDHLINIAERYFSRPEHWPAVQKANRIRDPHRILPGTVLRIPADLLRKEPGHAVLDNVHGAVRWRSGDADWQAAANGQRLTSGTTLETPSDSSALLVLADGSRVVVSPNTQLTLDTLSLYADGLMADTRLRLQRGQADITANPTGQNNQNLKIQTPSAQAVVRGTHFRLGASDDVTREETVSGLVGVASSGQGVDVPKNKGTVARAGEAPMRPVPLLPAADVSGLPARFEHLPLRFPLPRLAGAVEWAGQIALDPQFEHLLLDKSVRGESLSFADLPNGDYRLRLRALDAHGLRGRDAVHPFTVFARPFPPGLNMPGDTAILRIAKPQFAWGNVVDITRYRFQISVSADFSNVLYDETLDGDRWQLPEELPAGPLYWRAASVSTDAQQGPWNVAAFTYKPGPGAADLGRAALQIESDKLSLKLPPPPEGLFYEALLSPDPKMDPVLLQTRSEDGVLELPRPEAGTYYLGVRLVDQSDNTPGPIAAQKIEIPPSRLWWLLLLLPLAL